MFSKTIKNTLDIKNWDIKNIEIIDDYGEPLVDPEDPTGYDFIPEEYHEEMTLMQTAKYYQLTPTYLNEEIGFDVYVRMSSYIKAFNYSHPKKKGQIRPGR